MDTLALSVYMKGNVTKNWLDKTGFRMNKSYSSKGNNVFTYCFPLLKYMSITTVECELNYSEKYDEFTIEVVYSFGQNRNKYFPFYHPECKNGIYKTMLETINDKIESEIKRLGLKKK